MKILEKIIRNHTGGGCEISSIAIEEGSYIYIGIYTNCDGYSIHRGSKDLVNSLKNTNDLLVGYGIDGTDFDYCDLLTYDSDIMNMLEYLEGDYIEPSDEYNDDIVEKYLLKRIKGTIRKQLVNKFIGNIGIIKK